MGCKVVYRRHERLVLCFHVRNEIDKCLKTGQLDIVSSLFRPIYIFLVLSL